MTDPKQDLIERIVAGFDYDPGHSDLDDEQPIHVRMTLGDYRKARRILYSEGKTKWVAHP